MPTTETSVLTNLRDLYDLDAERRADVAAREALRTATDRAERESAHRKRKAREEADRLAAVARVEAEERARRAAERSADERRREDEARLEGIRLAEVERVRLTMASTERDRARAAELEAARIAADRGSQRTTAVVVAALLATVLGIGAFIVVERGNVARDADAREGRMRQANEALRDSRERIAAERVALEGEHRALVDAQNSAHRTPDAPPTVPIRPDTRPRGTRPPVAPPTRRNCPGPLCGIPR